MDLSLIVSASIVIALLLNAIAGSVALYMARRAFEKTQTVDCAPRPPVLPHVPLTPTKPPVVSHTISRAASKEKWFDPVPAKHSLYELDSDGELACRHCGGSYRSANHHEWCRYRVERDSDQYLFELKRQIRDLQTIITENDWEGS